MTTDSQGRTYDDTTLYRRYTFILRQAIDIENINTRLTESAFKNAYLYTAHGSISNNKAFIVPQNVTLIFLTSSNKNYAYRANTAKNFNKFDSVINLDFCKNMFSSYNYSINKGKKAEYNINNCHIYPQEAFV